MKASKPNRALLVFSGLITCLAWPASAMLWVRLGERAPAISIFGMGLSLGPCLAAYAVVPTNRKQKARRVVLFTGGLSTMAFSLLGTVNIDLEGFFMLLFAGAMGAAIGHNLVTVLVGPVVFGRVLCGWGCWRSMVLELLPIRHGAGRKHGSWAVLPLVGLVMCVAFAASVVVVGHRAGAVHAASAKSIAIAFGIYYTASIGLAFALQDQRAFCKYLCPNAAILRLTSRLSLLKMSANQELCNDCGACSRSCPMDIDVAHFAVLGQRVTSGECILCQRCAHACQKDALRLTIAFDVSRQTPFIRRGSLGDK